MTTKIPYTLLKDGTPGELLTWDGTNAPATVAVGTAGHVLTSNGAGSPPTFQAPTGGGGGGGAVTITPNSFSGTGAQTAFVLSSDPGNENNTFVYIDGVYQDKDTYSVAGTTLTFTTAPATGTNNIEVMVVELSTISSIDDLSDVDTTTVAPTDGQALVWDNGAGQWEPGTISGGGGSPTETFTSTQQTITNGGNLVLAHGLSSKPAFIQGYYNVSLSQDYSGEAQGWGISATVDATNIDLRFGANGQIILHKSTGLRAVMTIASWRLVVRAWGELNAGAAASGNAISEQFLHIQDQKADGTNGGSATGGTTQTRDLNTVLTNEITGASLSANQITLPDGTYYIEAEAPAYQVDTTQAFLYNVTDASTELAGNSSMYSGNATQSGGIAQQVEQQHQVLG
jgi:hypothetical protein